MEIVFYAIVVGGYNIKVPELNFCGNGDAYVHV